MNKIEIPIPEGYKAEWVNGVLTLVDDKPIEYKFKVGDKVTFRCDRKTHTVFERFITEKGCPAYKLDDWEVVEEDKIRLYNPQPIITRIDTFEDACNWCCRNNYDYLFRQLGNARRLLNTGDLDSDITAYLKLRIITCALNEGWQPTSEEMRYTAYYDETSGAVETSAIDGYNCDSSIKLCFRDRRLAEYAATQFRDIYEKFCSAQEGGEE